MARVTTMPTAKDIVLLLGPPAPPSVLWLGEVVPPGLPCRTHGRGLRQLNARAA